MCHFFPLFWAISLNKHGIDRNTLFGFALACKTRIVNFWMLLAYRVCTFHTKKTSFAAYFFRAMQTKFAHTFFAQNWRAGFHLIHWSLKLKWKKQQKHIKYNDRYEMKTKINSIRILTFTGFPKYDSIAFRVEKCLIMCTLFVLFSMFAFTNDLLSVSKKFRRFHVCYDTDSVIIWSSFFSKHQYIH